MSDALRGAWIGQPTPDQAAERRAAIVRDYTHGAMTMTQVAQAYGITKQRVSQIVKAARRAEIKARCASGKHGETTESEYTAWVWGQGPTRAKRVVCNDCGEVIEP